MKYKMLLLLALVCAIGVSAISGTLAGYADREAFSFSIQPDTQQATPSPQAAQTTESAGKPEKADMPTETGDAQASSEQEASETPAASTENNG